MSHDYLHLTGSEAVAGGDMNPTPPELERALRYPPCVLSTHSWTTKANSVLCAGATKGTWACLGGQACYGPVLVLVAYLRPRDPEISGSRSLC